LNFNNVRELKVFLQDKVDIDLWKRPNYNTVDDLYEEIMRNETTLSISPLCRSISIVKIFIYQEGKILVEEKIVTSSNKCQLRNTAPSEKMFSNETPLEAFYRGLQEELNIKSDQVKYYSIKDPYTESMNSPSYPGLLSSYKIYECECQLIIRLESNFTTKEIEKNEEIIHTWKLVEKDKIKSIFGKK
jgi:hypothetical protein